MKARPLFEEGRPLARALPFHRAWSDNSRRSSRRARATSARAAPPPKREAAQWRAQVRCTRKPAHEVNATAGTWGHGLPPKKGGLSLVQCPFVGYGATTASAARHAHVASARAVPPPQRQLERWRTSALHAQATSRSGRCWWYVGARPCTEERTGLSLAQCPSIRHRATTASKRPPFFGARPCSHVPAATSCAGRLRVQRACAPLRWLSLGMRRITRACRARAS